jgi:hypothetical protein
MIQMPEREKEKLPIPEQIPYHIPPKEWEDPPDPQEVVYPVVPG